MQPELQKNCSKLPSAMLQVDWHHVGILATSVAMHRFARSVWHSGMPCTCCTDKLLLVTLRPCLGLLHHSISCHASFQVSMPVFSPFRMVVPCTLSKSRAVAVGSLSLPLPVPGPASPLLATGPDCQNPEALAVVPGCRPPMVLAQAVTRSAG